MGCCRVHGLVFVTRVVGVLETGCRYAHIKICTSTHTDNFPLEIDCKTHAHNENLYGLKLITSKSAQTPKPQDGACCVAGLSLRF